MDNMAGFVLLTAAALLLMLLTRKIQENRERAIPIEETNEKMTMESMYSCNLEFFSICNNLLVLCNMNFRTVTTLVAINLAISSFQVYKHNFSPHIFFLY